MNREDKERLEERIINWTILTVDIVESMSDSKVSNYFAGQLLRSCSSPALNYAEAQDPESRNDFIHKIKIILKELRESRVSLKIVARRNLSPLLAEIIKAQKECNELIAIFVASIKTVKKNASP